MPRLIWRCVAMNVMLTIEYRGEFVIRMINTLAGPLISLLVWLTVSEQGVHLPYDRDQFITYYLLLSLVSMLTATWLGGYLAATIRQGDLSPWLLRPAPYIVNQIGNNIGEKLIKLVFLCPMVGLVAVFFRASLPTDPRAWLLFALSLPLAASVAFLLDFVIGSLAFWVQDVWGLIRVKELVGGFLAGQWVPLALFPARFRGLLQIQPFRYTLSFPLEVLTGHLTPAALTYGFAWQVGYCVLLWACYRIIWRYGLRAYAATGA